MSSLSTLNFVLLLNEGSDLLCSKMGLGVYLKGDEV